MLDRILFASVAGFVTGIAFHTSITSGYVLPAFLVFLAFAVLAAQAWTSTFLALCISGALIGGAFGMFRSEIFPSDLSDSLKTRLGAEIAFEGYVYGEPDVRENSQRIPVLLETDGIRERVLVIAETYPPIRLGDRVEVQGLLKSPEPFQTDSGREFRYDRFLAKDRVFSLVERAHVEVIGGYEGPYVSIRSYLSSTKQAFIRSISSALPEPHASLAAGLIAGGKQGLGQELLDAFIVTGLVHIVVLSGYNVMIIAEGVLKACSFLQRRYAAILAGIVIAAFVLAASAGPASIRAGIMAGIALLARATGRTYAVTRALIISLCLMLLHSPLLLLYDPGFQLSFIATLGLLYLAPVTDRWFMFVQSNSIRDVASATVAAQVAVLPLLLYQSGVLSIISFPVNILVLPVIPLTMAAVALAGLLGMIFPGAIMPIFGLPAYVLLSYVFLVVTTASSMPYAAVTLPPFPLWVVAIAYGCMVIWIWRIRRSVRPQHSQSDAQLHPS